MPDRTRGGVHRARTKEPDPSTPLETAHRVRLGARGYFAVARIASDQSDWVPPLPREATRTRS